MTDIMKETAIFGLGTLFTYYAIRITSYIINPRPYLWWHGTLDIGATIYIILKVVILGTLLERKARKESGHE